jgi:hypothetical protein
MKKTIVFLVLIALLASAVPVLAEGQEVVGERINLMVTGNQRYPANQPFHIKHGIIFTPSLDKYKYAEALGQWDFKLDVDGQPVQPDYVDHFAYGNSPDVDPEEQHWVGFLTVYNFPEGMTGTHIFTAHWIWPCFAVYGEEACPDKMAPIDFSNEVKVIFK